MHTRTAFLCLGGNLTAVYGADGFGDLFIWEETKLYYSPNGGISQGTVTVYTGERSELHNRCNSQYNGALHTWWRYGVLRHC